jgi:hypothetical protein
MTEVPTDEAQSLDLLAVLEPHQERPQIAMILSTAKVCEGYGNGTNICALSKPGAN